MRCATARSLASAFPESAALRQSAKQEKSRHRPKRRVRRAAICIVKRDPRSCSRPLARRHPRRTRRKVHPRTTLSSRARARFPSSHNLTACAARVRAFLLTSSACMRRPRDRPLAAARHFRKNTSFVFASRSRAFRRVCISVTVCASRSRTAPAQRDVTMESNARCRCAPLRRAMSAAWIKFTGRLIGNPIKLSGCSHTTTESWVLGKRLTSDAGHGASAR